MKTHFHNQEQNLLQTTSKKTFITIAVTSILLAFAYTNSYAITKNDLSGCTTIKVQYLANHIIESDSIDEYTLNLSKDDAIKKVLNLQLVKSYEILKNKGNCTISVNLNS